jgi:CPA1 family monovalent cation:H+ antiporter
VLAVVVAGLYLGHRAPEGGFATRLQDRAVWNAADTVLESFVFALIGLQLRSLLADVDLAVGSLLLTGAALVGVAVLARVAWVFATAYIRGALFSFPGRETVLFLAFCVTIGTLLLHGLTLPWVIKLLGVRGSEEREDALAEAAAQHAAARAAVGRLDEMAQETTPQDVAGRLRAWAEHRSLGAWERLGRPPGENGESPTAAFRRLRREMLAAERETFVQYRNQGRIDDEVLRRVLHELDLEEALLSRD